VSFDWHLETPVVSRKAVAAAAVVVGLAALFGAVVLDLAMERHREALAAGIFGAVLTFFGTAYHVILPRQRGHRHRDRSPRR